ncbi:MAG TPA: FtsX-like permease family protein [Gemmatimonadaceae bacterium]
MDRPSTLAQIDATAASDLNTGREAAASCAALVLLLSAIGLYGIVTLSVGQRQREIGVRMALGAGAGQVVALFYRSGLALGTLGLIVGLPIGLLAAHFLPVIEVQGGESDPISPNLILVGGIVVGVVLVMTSIATLVPASRAATVDPVAALRTE